MLKKSSFRNSLPQRSILPPRGRVIFKQLQLYSVFTIIEKNSTLKDNSPIIRITIDLIGLEYHEQLYSGVITRMSSCFSISRRLVVKLFTWRSDLKGFDHNLKNATVKEYLCGMREVYNENKPIVLAENSNETDLSFKSAVMKKENPSITMYLGVDNCLDVCKISDFMRPHNSIQNLI